MLDLLIHDDISIKLRFQIVLRLISLAVASSEVNLSGHILISMHFFSHISVLSFDSYQSMKKSAEETDKYFATAPLQGVRVSRVEAVSVAPETTSLWARAKPSRGN